MDKAAFFMEEEILLKKLLLSLSVPVTRDQYLDLYLEYLLTASRSNYVILYDRDEDLFVYSKTKTYSLNDLLSEWRDIIIPFLFSGMDTLSNPGIQILPIAEKRDNGPVLVFKKGELDKSGLWTILYRLHPSLGLLSRTTKPDGGGLNGHVYESPGMKDILQTVQRIGPTEIPVLVMGESGTGKELLARLIHEKSKRKNHLFLPLNCSAISESLLETELFGYKKGSFTDALEDKPGLLHTANKGTVFLDEIGDMSRAFQSKLLRFIETGEYQPVGGTLPEKSDVRMISATNKDLSKEINNGNFRSDLYYRISVCRIAIPPLRERREDIKPLIDFFLMKYNSYGQPRFLAEDLMLIFQNHDWKGNVRELENVIQRLLTSTGEKVIGTAQLSNMAEFKKNNELNKKSYKDAVNLYKKRLIQSTLELYNDNQTQAARALGLQRTYLIKLINELGIRKDSED
jgi:DNA-binding NtrC family response regulator